MSNRSAVLSVSRVVPRCTPHCLQTTCCCLAKKSITSLTFRVTFRLLAVYRVRDNVRDGVRGERWVGGRPTVFCCDGDNIPPIRIVYSQRIALLRPRISRIFLSQTTWTTGTTFLLLNKTLLIFHLKSCPSCTGCLIKTMN